MSVDGTYAISVRNGDSFVPVGEVELAHGALNGAEAGGLRFSGGYHAAGPDLVRIDAVVHLEAGTVTSDGTRLDCAVAHHLSFTISSHLPGRFEHDVEIPGLGSTWCRFEKQ